MENGEKEIGWNMTWYYIGFVGYGWIKYIYRTGNSYWDTGFSRLGKMVIGIV